MEWNGTFWKIAYVICFAGLGGPFPSSFANTAVLFLTQMCNGVFFLLYDIYKNGTVLRFTLKFDIETRDSLENRMAWECLEKSASVIRLAYFWGFQKDFDPQR